jgi:FkbM family methyltransferase
MDRAHRVATPARKLRPAKINNAVKRRWFEHQMHRISLAPAADVFQIGSAYGGWTLPEGVIDPSWTCYSVGAGGDITFDMELIDRYGLTVRSFDAVEAYVEHARIEGAGRPRFSAHHAAIGLANGPVRFQMTHDETSKSVSPAGLYESDEYVELPGRTIHSLMTEFGDSTVELLKLDIEGGEYDLLPQLDLRSLGFRVFAVQLHHTGTLRGARGIVEDLREAGYEPVGSRKAVKLTFLDRRAREHLRTTPTMRAGTSQRSEGHEADAVEGPR